MRQLWKFQKVKLGIIFLFCFDKDMLNQNRIKSLLIKLGFFVYASKKYLQRNTLRMNDQLKALALACRLQYSRQQRYYSLVELNEKRLTCQETLQLQFKLRYTNQSLSYKFLNVPLIYKL